jgi:hypothetical protein
VFVLTHLIPTLLSFLFIVKEPEVVKASVLCPN